MNTDRVLARILGLRAFALVTGVSLVLGCAIEDGTGEETEGTENRRVTQESVANRRFGIHSTDDYENAWQTNLLSSTAMSRFRNELDNEAPNLFWYDLWNKAYYWGSSGDDAPNSLEDVDMFVHFTHGGAQTNDAIWAMWNDGAFVYSSSMTLGNENRGTSIWAGASCKTLQIDSNTWERWDTVFSGGLRAVLGSHNILKWNTKTYDVFKVYAQYLNAGYTLKDAWWAGWESTIDQNQDVAVMFTGTTASSGVNSCSARRDGMSWDNFDSYPRLTGTNIAVWCGWIWDNI